MTYIIILGIIINIIFLCITYYLYRKTKKIQYYKIKQIEEKHSELFNLKKEISTTKNLLNQYQQNIKQSKNQLIFLHQEQDRLKNELNEKQININKYYKSIEQQAIIAFNNYEKGLDQAYQQTDKKYNNKIQKIKAQRDSVQADLDQLKGIYKAATAAKLREQEEQNKLSFYKIHITDKQATDISKLQDFKKNLYDPTLVSKIIWSSYIMKPTSEMCKRVLGTSNPICGIYKITNKSTEEIYIGQSVNIAERWKQHIKCGLGIDASSTNNLYNSMQNTGVFNFTFELLEQCDRDKLNEKERFWIDMYSSNKIGLNMTKGNK